MVGPPQIETMMAKDVVMCNTGECVAAGKRKYQPGAVMDVPVSPVSRPLSGPAREWREYVAGWGSGIVNITLTFPVNKMMFRQQLHGISAWDSAGQLRAEGLVSCPENIIESRKYLSPQVSLYRGILPPLLQKSVTTALMFGTYEQYRRVLVEAGHVSVTQTQSLVIAAFGAGCTEALLTPFERVQTLMLDHRWIVRLVKIVFKIYAFSQMVPAIPQHAPCFR